METIPFFRALLFVWCMMYSIYRIINEKLKTRAIEPCKSEVPPLYRLGDTLWRKGKVQILLTLHARFAPHLSINLAFLHDDGTRIPWQRSHHLRECTVAFSNGSCKIAPGISFSVTSTAEVASFI